MTNLHHAICNLRRRRQRKLEVKAVLCKAAHRLLLAVVADANDGRGARLNDGHELSVTASITRGHAVNLVHDHNAALRARLGPTRLGKGDYRGVHSVSQHGLQRNMLVSGCTLLHTHTHTDLKACFVACVTGVQLHDVKAQLFGDQHSRRCLANARRPCVVQAQQPGLGSALREGFLWRPRCCWWSLPDSSAALAPGLVLLYLGLLIPAHTHTPLCQSLLWQRRGVGTVHTFPVHIVPSLQPVVELSD